VLVGVADDSFDDGAVVQLPGPARRPVRWQVEVHQPVPGRPPTEVLVSADVAPAAPHLWAVLSPAGAEHDDQVDLVDLVAFSTADHPAGAVVGRAAFDRLPIAWSNQVAAVRWSPSTGVVGQVYVAPEHRRLRVASWLLMVAAGVRVSMGWTSLRSDGRLTDLGDAWLTRAPDWWRSRVPERAAHLPPMTPSARAAGVPERNLVPDRT
jgi:GNAT superfamily N-acetyltransferase